MDEAVPVRFYPSADVTTGATPFPLYPDGGPESDAVEDIPYAIPDFRSPDTPQGGGNGLLAFSY